MWIDVHVKTRTVGTVTAYFVTGTIDRKWTGLASHMLPYLHRTEANVMQNTVEYDNGKSLTFAVSGSLKETRYSEGWFHTEYTEWNAAIKALQKGEPALSPKDGKVLGKVDQEKLIKSMEAIAPDLNG